MRIFDFETKMSLRDMIYDEPGWLGSWHIPVLIVGNQDELPQQPWNEQRESMRSRNA